MITYMSQYLNNQSLFMEPKTTQYGSHMVMTDVTMSPTIKYLNMDTRYSDDFDKITSANYNITLPERVNDVKSLKVRCAEIPVSFYNISVQLDNNVFNVTESGTTHTFYIPDGLYDDATLVAAINGELAGAPAPVNQLVYSIVGKRSVFTNTSGVTMNLQFDVSQQGATDLQNMTYKLGWILGFRETDYSIQTISAITSDSFVDFHLPRYLFLVINEFKNTNPYSFVTLMQSSEINRSQIVARIAMDYVNYPFGTVLRASEEQGYIVSDRRVYSGPTNLQRMNVQLVNERGIPMDLNGLDFSFCLELVCE
jgi:hypothetical protein